MTAPSETAPRLTAAPSPAPAQAARSRDDEACVGAHASLLPGGFAYLTCFRNPEGTVVLADPLIDLTVRLLDTGASVNDSRSLSLIGNLIAFGGTCIIGFTPLGSADTDSSSHPDGTSSTSEGRGTLPVTFVELAYVSVPTDPNQRPAGGVAVAAATTPDGDARSSGTVTRERAESEVDTSEPGFGVGVAVHSEDLLGDAGAPGGAALTPAG